MNKLNAKLHLEIGCVNVAQQLGLYLTGAGVVG
jgi:hypothetical protein